MLNFADKYSVPAFTETLVSRIRTHVQRSPERTILRFLGDQDGALACLDYAQLDRRARAIAMQLREAGASGERALVLHAPGADYVTALLGCFYAGVVAVPAYPPRNRGLARLRAIVQDADARFALTSDETREKMSVHLRREPELSALTWLSTDRADESRALDWQAPTLDPNATALLQYTSGSTSSPKGVRLSHANFLDNIDALSELRGNRDDDRVVSWLPPFHDMGLVCGILMPLCTGLETILLAPTTFLQRPFRWLSAISEFRGTISGGPNFAFELCLRRVVEPAQLEMLDLGSWRVAFCGAERVRADTFERFAAAFAPAGFRKTALTSCYGLAESTVAVAFSTIGEFPPRVSVDEQALGEHRVATPQPERPAQTLVACGKPIRGCEITIVDPVSHQPLPEDRVGEIWIRGASVAAGYWRKPDLTERVFQTPLAGSATPGHLRSGDLGFLHGGNLFIAGRIKDLIVLRGVNHFPEDLESTAQASHAQLRLGGGAAFAVDQDGEERVVIVHEIESARAAPLDEIVTAIKSAVAENHEILVHDVVLVTRGAVPKTSSGKVQRNLCREQYLAGQLEALNAAAQSAAQGPAAPTDTVEHVARLMAEVLGVKTMSGSDDFFWLGGHSLMATQLVSRIRESFSIDLPLRAVFEASTPIRLAARIQSSAAIAALPPIEPVDRRQPLVLSFSQERMWVLHHLDPQSAAYNVAGATLLEGPLDVEALRRSLDLVVERHEILRTSYPTVDGEAGVVIAASLTLPLPIIDCTGRPDPDATALSAASALAHAPFDIAAAPLIRAELYRLGSDRHLLGVCMHHLVTDAWSVGLLVADLLAFYEDFAAGRTPPPAQPGSLGYIDYAHWQRRHLTDAHLSRQLSYWKGQLEGAKPVELPSDRPRSQRRGSDGAYLPLPLPDSLIESLNALSVARGTTLFMIMLAAFEVLLYRYTGESDLIVGVPVANRNRLASESLMGTLVNTLALRLRFDPDASFAQLLTQVREVALDAYANQDLPFERLISQLNVERRRGESPLVSVMFDFQNAPTPGSAGALQVRPVAVSRGASQFDLSLLVFDTELGRLASIEYSTDLFDADAMRRLLGHYISILESIALNPEIAVSRIPLLSASERRELLALGSGAPRPPAAIPSIEAAFAAHVLHTPDAPAIVDDLGSLSYRDLDRESTRLARRLESLGARPGERIAILLDRDRRVPIVMLATLKTGAAYVPLDPRHPAERLAFTLQNCEPRVVVTERKYLAAVPPELAVNCLYLDDVADGLGDARDDARGDARGNESGRHGSHPPSARDPAAAAYILYTSGSTGRPKGVEVSAAALTQFLRSMSQTPGMESSDRLLAVTTFAFDIAGLELWLPLVTGGCVRLVPSEITVDGPALLRLMQVWRPTVMQATPATWKMLLEAGWAGDPTLKVLCGGEAFPYELAQALIPRSHSVWNMYGPTETTIWSAVHKVKPSDGPKIPIGAPIDETRIYIVDRHGELQPWGVPGEIFIGGAGVANGYFRRPDLTRERFVADGFTAAPGMRMYRTGDGGRLRFDGRFECLARLDDQIKLRGFRIEPGEIEALIKQDARVRDAVVVAREDRPGDQRLVAYYVAAGPHAPSDANAPSSSVESTLERDLVEALQRRLPAYMIPSVFVALEALPVTPNGKIDRRRLPAPADDRSRDEDRYLAPRDQVEEDLVRLWEPLLGKERIGIRDDFFRLGGHSLLAVRLYARIEKHFGIALPLSTLLERPTIEFLADHIRAQQIQQNAVRPSTSASAPTSVPASAAPTRAAAPRFSFLVPIQPSGTRPALFCVHGAGGHVLNFSNLSRRLGPKYPLYGFQARGTDGRTKPFAHIEEMADEYLRELRALQPQGPYYLTGYCGGGIIAFEMARKLRAAGQVVALLALLDSYRPGAVAGTPRNQAWAKAFRDAGFPDLWRRAAAKVRRDLRETSLLLSIGVHRLLGKPMPFEVRDFWLTQSFLKSAQRYPPRVYPGKLTVLRAMQVDPELLGVGPELGWTEFAKGGIAAFDVPGDHHSLMQEPHIGVLADTLKECLEDAAGRVAA